MSVRAVPRLVASVILSLTTTAAGAGVSTQATAPNFPVDDIAVFAKSVEWSLASKQARVALVARVGRPTG